MKRTKKKNLKKSQRHQMFSTCRDLLKTHYIICCSLSMRSAAVTLVSRLALHCQHSNNTKCICNQNTDVFEHKEFRSKCKFHVFSYKEEVLQNLF